ncbi:hypothetical protein EJ05DRAFT_532530 [Pseudovirgaria hyperparasitica]|uniref:RING-type domain-containing protein n=1 Tax=Pseudovirgaria hyperparasitica TaxID=470096 RepID=A0A6A6W1A7_9PEZI|nr:uncharacterized protein EJ05DRAFT_532530 [Pseudovirgaria hyperparasitica]KAF2756692.1 hypothetical protein EJ05DRAFT_532530 [Pseudovirgaria hyperparasitica]
MAGSAQSHDLLIITDATYSMSNYLEALQDALPKIISVSSLTNCFARIGLLAYRDYCDTKLIEWSGWLDQTGGPSEIEPSKLLNLAENLDATGGGDFPEALKTALAKAYEVMREDASTLILLYTDAAPHSSMNGEKDRSSNYYPEQKALSKPDSYGGYGPLFQDWISACNILYEGKKKATVFCFIERWGIAELAGYYQYLSLVTRGMCVYLSNPKPIDISQATVETLLAWMSVSKAGPSEERKVHASLARFVRVKGIRNLKNEKDAVNAGLFDKQTCAENTAEVDFTSDVLKKHLPKKDQAVLDFAKRYTQDSVYKDIVIRELTAIIQRDVSAISLNPVFGSLWRAVCNDRGNASRDTIITAFGAAVERLSDAEEKARMKQWLEESYDYTAEVLDAIERVPEAERFPCVLLDPTLAFTRDNDDQADDADINRAITGFRRDELLEIGRSCDYRILKRLGKVLTRLTFVDSASDLPAHLADASHEKVTKLPMALADKRYERKFWKVLLHLVVPGTMLAARPAALLAALSIRLGIKPLTRPAIEEMMPWRTRWNNLEIPETWNVGCLGLLLDADSHESTEDKQRVGANSGLLLNEDRALFDKLVSYKMLELNLKTDLPAKITWTPDKTSMPIGKVIVCRGCKFPRSVTIMSTGGRCGLCAVPQSGWTSAQVRGEMIASRVSKDDNENTSAIWVECNTSTCRAQYVVYNPKQLNIRPRCHYCRAQAEGETDPAPWIECHKCLSRVIWPKEYRTSTLIDYFTCIACTENRDTIIERTTTAEQLTAENGTSWLIRNDTTHPPFPNRTLFHTISTTGTRDFASKITLFPLPTPQLVLAGKPLFNTPALLASLQSWVLRRRSESASCSLCFTTLRKPLLRPACGRSGCTQRVCTPCLSGWYGLNGTGRIINTAALHCPFCRRAPAPKTLAKCGMGIRALAGLGSAVRDRGTWIYAWCGSCGTAKKHMERVCANGAPAEITDFKCQQCVEKRRKGMRTVTVKKCPGCGTATAKTYGCDHMACPVRMCGAHWCWHCGEAPEDGNIYGHMSQCHDGYYAGVELDTKGYTGSSLDLGLAKQVRQFVDLAVFFLSHVELLRLVCICQFACGLLFNLHTLFLLIFGVINIIVLFFIFIIILVDVDLVVIFIFGRFV